MHAGIWSLRAFFVLLTPCAWAQPLAPEAERRSKPSPEAASEERRVVLPPRLLQEPNVAYPEAATGEATVVLTLVVGPDGSVRSATPETEVAPFSNAAVEAALQFRFQPATRDGVPVAAKIRFEVRFRPPPIEAPEPSDRSEAEPAAAEVAAPRAQPPAASSDVLVVGRRGEPSRSASLTRAEVREIPGTFGDPFRAIEAMPGVTPIVSGLPFFFVRGAPPGNVGYYLDGIRVPLLFHVGAGPSVVHPGLMDRVDLYPGGYPARYGRYAGGIVAGEALGPSAEARGEFNLRAFDAGGLLEVPLWDGRANVLVGGRYSYTALILSQLSPDTALEYWDYQARGTLRVSERDTLGFFAFGAYDYVGQRSEVDGEPQTLFGTQFHRLDLRYDHSLGERGHLRTALTLGVDSSRLQAQDRSVRDQLASARTELEYRVSPSVSVRAGTDIGFDSYDVLLGTNDLSPTAARVSQFFPTRTDVVLGAHADAVIAIDRRLEVVPGVRTDVYGSDGAVALAVDPRFGFRAKVSERLALIGAFGLAHQAPAFVVPLPGFQPGGLRGGLQKAIQESAGIDLELGAGTTLTASVFQNAFFDMSDPLGATEPTQSGCAPGAYPADSLGGDLAEQPDESSFCGARFDPGTLGPDRSGGGGQAADSRRGRTAGEAFEVRTTGSAYGLEVFLKRRMTSRFGGFLSYTLSRSTRSYQNREYIASFDRTHVFNVAAAYDLGRGFRAGSRIMFYSGLPKVSSGEAGDSARLPAFFRLDLRLEKRFQLGKKSQLAIVAEWMNATLSKEAVTTTCTLDGCEAEMIGPVTIPSLGLEGTF
jgi:TonB family protein